MRQAKPAWAGTLETLQNVVPNVPQWPHIVFVLDLPRVGIVVVPNDLDHPAFAGRCVAFFDVVRVHGRFGTWIDALQSVVPFRSKIIPVSWLDLVNVNSQFGQPKLVGWIGDVEFLLSHGIRHVSVDRLKQQRPHQLFVV